MNEIKVDYTEGMTNESGHESFEVNVLQAVLQQAVSDVMKADQSHTMRMEALEWLTDEDNPTLQLCLSVCNIDHEYLLKHIAKEKWNLDL